MKGLWAGARDSPAASVTLAWPAPRAAWVTGQKLPRNVSGSTGPCQAQSPEDTWRHPRLWLVWHNTISLASRVPLTVCLFSPAAASLWLGPHPFPPGPPPRWHQAQVSGPSQAWAACLDLTLTMPLPCPSPDPAASGYGPGPCVPRPS